MELGNSIVKTPEPETETPKSLPLTNGVLKRHAPLHRHHPVVITYKECLKNHAASIGGHAVDGCGEFMPSPKSNPTQPTTLKCAACGCHRNFHRRESDEPPPNSTPALEYQSHHRHHPPPPLAASPNDSPSPPPISSSYYPSAPQVLLALSHGLSAPPSDSGIPISSAVSTPVSNPNHRKRFRTKFSQNQKDKMLDFAERVGWKLQKIEEAVISDFCSEIGVDRSVLRVWMHNNKNSVGKREQPEASQLPTPPSAGVNYSEINFQQKSDGLSELGKIHHHRDNGATAHDLTTNGNSST